MKENLKNNKVIYTIIGIILVALVVIGITYAYWLITRTQQGENVIISACLDIDLVGENDITLTNQYPISDTAGMELTPYEFTVTNKCNTAVDYQVALEALEVGNEITSEALKVALNEDITLLSQKGEVTPTINGTYESRKLATGTLAAKSTTSTEDEVTYELRIWLDENASMDEMNKTFRSKITVTVGQGITNSTSQIKEGTLAYDILANYGGAEGIQTISIEPTEMITTSGDRYISTLSNYYYGTEKVFNSEEGKYTLGGTVVEATISECRTGTKTCGKYTLMQTSADAQDDTIYEVTDFKTSNAYVTVNTIAYTTEFGRVTTALDAGLYKAQDDLGDSYYFRGAPTNNYVQFGTYAENTTLTVLDKTIEVKAGTPMYWRIVRINGDGSIRLIYDGTEKVANGVAHTATIASTAYNANNDDAKYVGYTYDVDGTQKDSTVKGVVDAWYEKHLKTTYGSYIADSIFCNDRSVATTDIYGYIYYASHQRLYTNKAPVLTCTNKEDRYTVSDTTNGNGELTNPVGLLTADEAVMAGGNNRAGNMSFYLYSDETYWTSTPNDFNDDGAYVLFFSSSVSSLYVSNGYYGARPVINLKADVKFTGKGTIDDPYKIVTE